MLQASIVLFWLAFCGFLMASVFYVYWIVRHATASNIVPRVITVLAWVALTASIGMRSVVDGGTRLNGPNQLTLIAWALVLVYFLIEYVLRFSRYGAILIPVTAVLLFVAQVVAPGLVSAAPTPLNISEQMNSVNVVLHVLLIVFGNAMLLIGCVASGLYIYQASSLRKHRNSTLSRALPPLANIERMGLRIAGIGLAVYFAGLIMGITRAIVVDAHLWYTDARIMLSGAVLVVFMVSVLGRRLGRLSGLAAAHIACAGGVLVLLLMVLARTVPVGFHVFGAL
ncbi:MAG: cytochrome c biogenesis protein CcsA [Actinomycetes bacterium]|jgi:ABC-type uncharacterized transport system permease subunit|nr:cytochrome c biogenesis protein CcsA [Actinomycetes bacterium]